VTGGDPFRNYANRATVSPTTTKEQSMGFRLMPRFRHHLRKTYRMGPLRLHVGPEGMSWGLGAGRWSWNARSKRHTIDTPGPGYWESRGRR
jgi:hypothetical protein